MLIVAFILSLIMFSFLFHLRRKTRKKVFRNMAVSYMLLFGSLCIGVGTYLIYNFNFLSITNNISQDYSIEIPGIKRNNLIKKNNIAHQFKAPVIRQYPELPRGCEVTSIAMLLQYHDIDVNKMEVAEKVKKSETPYHNKNGVIHFGDPNVGFVGDMYNIENPGYGVYHKPLFDLTKKYVGEKAIDISGQSFENVIKLVAKGKPVVVITNLTYNVLPNDSFTTWETPNGTIDITKKLHAVLVTGFDSQSVYFNDPYDGRQKKAPKQEFVAAWEQLGSQAISIK
ncbi:uncharacterized protein YvpB [Alkalibacillus flavidus]|uniref:Uncharacterized protein YvpB n=1 Tax=Alkalibacillus flavidus TaxID=546021 RepID=A0ABV2KVB6_9BACI